MIKCYCALLLFVFFFFTFGAHAGTTGKIAGKITDAKTGEALPGVNIVIVGTPLGAQSDPSGQYTILNIRPGTYSVKATLIGYQSQTVVNTGVAVDYTTTINFSLTESAVEMQSVIVQGERNPLIRPDQTNPVAAISSETFQSLPVTEISQVVGLQAGIVVDDNGDLHVRGGRSNEISYTLNGLSINDPFNNLGSVGVATNALQEVSVSTGTFSAEYGNALSGVVNYVTKEGGAHYTGSIRTYSGDYVSNHSDVFPDIQKVDPFNQYRLEGTLGGPIPLTSNNNLTFYASGVYQRNNGYLYGKRIYNTTDFYVSRDQLNWSSSTDHNGVMNINPTTGDTTYTDPRAGALNDPYYFNPLNKSRYDSLGLPSGNGAIVPLNTSDSYNIQGNLSYHISPTLKLKYEAVADHGHSFSTLYYSYRYNPDGRPQNFSNSMIHSLDLTHTISNDLFYTVKLAYSSDKNETYAFPSINDPRYLPSFYQTTFPSTSFLSGGTYNERTMQSTQTYSAKFDIVAELFDEHEVKFGIEARAHNVKYEDYSLEFVDANNPSYVLTQSHGFYDVYLDSIRYVARIPSVANGYTYYSRNPKQFSTYIQDKIEIAKSLILNAGLRYEYFDPDAYYNPNLSTALSNQDTTFLTQGLKKASVKQNLSPRISIAYPITDQGVIRFSYGHFYQTANLASLYSNPDYRASFGTTPAFGNTNVNPQKSVQYEIGLQQGLTPDFRMDVTGFYKDVRDYIYTETVLTAKGDLQYQVLTNLSYANSRGITISLYQRRTPGSLFSGSLDYTFAVAEGNRTEPQAELFYSEKSGESPETFLVPLSFDRTHTLNAVLTLSEPNNWSVSTICRLQSGSPYTPSFPASLSTQQSPFIQNSGSKPLQWSVDLKAEKDFQLGSFTYAVFLQVNNVFDVKNQLDVWTNSGQALYSADQVVNPYEFTQTRSRIVRGDAGMIPLDAIDKYFVNPLNVSRPRLVQVGLSMYF